MKIIPDFFSEIEFNLGIGTSDTAFADDIVEELFTRRSDRFRAEVPS
jgi:hypothetical protein